jgi:hypothetical protein
MKWQSIKIVEFSGVEDDMPHTFNSTIFLPSSFWKMTYPFQKSLIRHELVHIFQRRFQEETEDFIYNTLHYRRWGPMSTFTNIRINPDTCYCSLYENIYDNTVVAPCFRSSNPSGVDDVANVYVHGRGGFENLKYEHPYEFMAYLL